MIEKNKQDNFIGWICGKNVPFPFFGDLPKVEMPIMEKDEDEETPATVDQRDQFIEWLCGKDVSFPFFDWLKVAMPIMETPEEVDAIVGVGDEKENEHV